MSIKNYSLILFVSCLSACNTLGEEGIRPYPGMSYSEFVRRSEQSLQGRPTAITSKNNTMIYTLPYHSQVYYWFENGVFTKMTKSQPDLRESWETSIPIPSR